MAIGLNFGQIRTVTRTYLDDRTGDRFVDAELGTFINLGQRHIQDLIDNQDEDFFIECKRYAVVPDDDALEFDLPEDFKRAVRIERMTDGRPVPGRWVDFRYRHDLNAWSTSNSESFLAIQPVCYLRTMKLGVVAPTESYTLTLWYIRALPDMTSDADVSEIPAEHRNLIAIHAAKLAQGSDEGALPPDLQQEYQEGLARLKESVRQRQKQAPRRIRYIPSY